MTGSLLAWALAAVVLFWSVGAYNRLVRLRAEANAAFATLDTLWQRQIELVHASLPDSLQPSQLTMPGELMDETTQLWAGLRGAATQFSASLGAMRPRPLHASTAAALTAAHEVLGMAWQRVQRDAHDLAGASMPDTVAAQWQQQCQEASAAQAVFNDAVTRYNHGIAQFPALLLAWLFGLRPARPV